MVKGTVLDVIGRVLHHHVWHDAGCCIDVWMDDGAELAGEFLFVRPGIARGLRSMGHRLNMVLLRMLSPFGH